jgi:predicted phage terminase large subunit-like protein
MESVSNNAIYETIKRQQAEKARTSMLDFVRYTKRDFVSGWFNELLCLEIDNFLSEVEKGLMPRLMIFAPPRSGKSEIASRRFPSYALGRFPKWNVISCSYASDLANRMSRDTQRIIDDPLYKDVFPETNLNTANVKTVSKGAIRTVDLWEIVNSEGDLVGGSYRAAGVNGGITGQGMNIGIIDDPAKDFKEASSKAYQETVIDWYDTTFYTRQDPRLNGIIIILTRWHKNDLAGQLIQQMKSGGEQWRIVSFPMVAEKDEYHEINNDKFFLRKEGDLLFPERMPIEYVEKCRARGSLVWNALYQQRPSAKGGGLLRSDWFGEYDVLPKLKYTVVIGDTAQKIKESNDFSVFEHWGLGDDGYLYLIDMIRGKWEADELKKRAVAFWNKCKQFDGSQCRWLGIEDKSSGTGLIQQLQKSTIPKIPVKAIPRAKDKLTRFLDVQGYIQSGYVKLPRQANWLNDFFTECEGLTAEFNTHDDQIDPLIDAIDLLLHSPRPNIKDIL